MTKKNIGTEKNPLYPVTVAELIEELKKLPPEAEVYAMTAFGAKPAHAITTLHDSGQVHILGRLTDRVLGKHATMADWWDALGQADREEVLRKRGLSVWPATKLWKDFGWFIQGVLNDNWWWNYVGDVRPAIIDGPVDKEE